MGSKITFYSIKKKKNIHTGLEWCEGEKQNYPKWKKNVRLMTLSCSVMYWSKRHLLAPVDPVPLACVQVRWWHQLRSHSNWTSSRALGPCGSVCGITQCPMAAQHGGTYPLAPSVEPQLSIVSPAAEWREAESRREANRPRPLVQCSGEP